jgi:hypothetical protein
MFQRCVGLSLGVVVCLQGFAVGQLPASRTVTLNIYEDPNDPESPVQTEIVLEVSAVEQDGDSVGWQVDSLSVARAVSDGTVAVWEQPLPDVVSADGLWWVDHADTQAPVTEEFAVVPWMAGVAESLDPRFTDLEFDLAGEVYTPPPEGAPFEVTTSLSYALRASSPDEPVDDSDDDEPVEIPGPINDPHCAPQ